VNAKGFYLLCFSQYHLEPSDVHPCIYIQETDIFFITGPLAEVPKSWWHLYFTFTKPSRPCYM